MAGNELSVSTKLADFFLTNRAKLNFVINKGFLDLRFSRS
jgi:hypothetical protein